MSVLLHSYACLLRDNLHFVAVTVVRPVSRIAFHSIPTVGMRAKIFTM
jgi:hypothetical protein